MSRLRAARSGGTAGDDGQSIRWVTVAKGIAILLMVYCHVWRGIANANLGVHSSFARICNTADAIIYGFHMPLFFFLSGMFIERSVRKSSRSFFDRKLRTIVYPYAVWSVLQCLAASMSPSTNRQALPLDAFWGLATRPYAQFWFLYVLTLCMLCYWVIHALRLGAKTFLAVTVLAYAAGPLVHLSSYGRPLAAIADWFVLYEWRSNALYFALGAAVGPAVLKWASTFSLRSLLAVTAIGVGIVAALVLPIPEEQQYPIAPIAAVVGMCAVFAASIALARKRRPVLEAIGEATLPIFAAHVVFAAAIRTVLHRGLHIEHMGIHLLMGTLLGVAAPMALRTFAARTGLPLFSLNAVKTLKRKTHAPAPPPAEAQPAPEELTVSSAA